MKNLLLILIIVGFTIYQATAQSSKSISIGPKLGLNVSSWAGDDFNTDSKTGIHIGAFSQIQMSEKFGFQPEIFYSAQGTKCGCGDAEIPVNYLNIPLLVKLDVYQRIYINAGPQIGFLLSAKDGDDPSAEDEFKGTDISLALGAGYSLPIGLHFHLRYNIGLSNINSEDFDEDTQSRVFQVSVGYILWKKSFDN